MSTAQAQVATTAKLRNKVIFEPLGPIARYHLRHALLLSSVPLLCNLLLTLLLSVFAKINLYFLESNGLIIDDQVRDAYFAQVQIEMMSVVGYSVLLLVMTSIVSIVVMRWASAPFVNANRTVETALNQPDQLRPKSRWASESPFFDRVIWLFSLRVKSGGENQVRDVGSSFITNFSFLAKFVLTFGSLSVLTGYLTYITIGSVYRRVVELAVLLVQSKSVSQAQHYFIAQEEVLTDAIWIITIASIAIYCYIGLKISRHMTNMIAVFAKAIEEDRFPIQLRQDDVYQQLAQSLNRARERIR